MQFVVEHLLLAAFAVLRAAFVLQGLAFGAAAAAAVLAAGAAWPDWLVRVVVVTAGLSMTLFLTALLMKAGRRWGQLQTDTVGGASAAWPLPFGVTMLLVAGLAAYAASPLPTLWSEIVARLNGTVDWEGLSRPAPNAGLVVLPLLVGLAVPALVTLAAFASIALPLALLMVLPDRRPRFMALFGMSALCQTGLSVASYLSALALSDVVGAATGLMRESGDAEVLQVAEQLTQASAIVSGTATRLLAPSLGVVAWLFALHPWRRT